MAALDHDAEIVEQMLCERARFYAAPEKFRTRQAFDRERGQFLLIDELPGVVRRMEERIDAEAPLEEKGMLRTTTFLLMGLRYDPEFSRQLLKGVMEMKESSTYQYIIQEGIEQGIEQGRTQEARRLLLIMGGKRFGEPDAQAQAALDKITSPQQLEQLAARLFEVESWQ